MMGFGFIIFAIGLLTVMGALFRELWKAGSKIISIGFIATIAGLIIAVIAGELRR